MIKFIRWLLFYFWLSLSIITDSRKIADMLNRIIHGYDSVSEDVIWLIGNRYLLTWVRDKLWLIPKLYNWILRCAAPNDDNWYLILQIFGDFVPQKVQSTELFVEISQTYKP